LVDGDVHEDAPLRDQRALRRDAGAAATETRIVMETKTA
jgi:hypothetical protein